MKLVLAAGLSAFAAFGCGGNDCESWEAGRPKIVELRYLQQSPGDPYELEFGIEFLDTGGDLDGGVVRLFVDGDEKDPRPMSEVFAMQLPPIQAGATSGELELLVKLASTIASDRKIEFGFVLEDARGEESNRPKVVLQALAPGR